IREDVDRRQTSREQYRAVPRKVQDGTAKGDPARLAGHERERIERIQDGLVDVGEVAQRVRRNGIERKKAPLRHPQAVVADLLGPGGGPGKSLRPCPGAYVRKDEPETHLADGTPSIPEITHRAVRALAVEMKRVARF